MEKAFEIKYYARQHDGTLKVLEDEHGNIENISSYIEDLKQSFGIKSVLAMVELKTVVTKLEPTDAA